MAGKSNKGAERLLTLRGNVWWFRQQIPEKCRYAANETRYILVNLHTADVVTAKRKRDDLEALTRLQFRQIKNGRLQALDLPGWPASGPASSAQSPAVRGSLSRTAVADAKLADDSDALELAVFAAEEELDRLKPSKRQAFGDAFTGKVEVDHHLDDYLSKASLAPKTARKRRGLVGRLATWCRNKGIKLDRVDRKIAGRYVSDIIDPMHPSTQKKHLIALRAYWRFLAQRGHISLASGESITSGWPWNDQLVEKRGKRAERGTRGQEERPFTDDEVKHLLFSPWPMRPEWEAPIRDALQISLLSGMRLMEVLTLWAEEVHDGVFDIQQGKTDAAARKVPIHPNLQGNIERRLRGKKPNDWVFHEVQHMKDPGDTIGKRFREAVGVDDRREGVRRSLVNFHSARRWFTTQARFADVPRETIADVIGHKADKSDITFGVYAREASELQRRACVEAVKLPLDHVNSAACR